MVTQQESRRNPAQFKSVSISTPLHDLIQQFIKDNPEYRSIADFISEATRVRMQELAVKKAKT